MTPIESVDALGRRTDSICYADGQVHHTGPLLAGPAAEWYMAAYPSVYFQAQDGEMLIPTSTYNQSDVSGRYDATTDRLGHKTETDDPRGLTSVTVYDDGFQTVTLDAPADQAVAQPGDSDEARDGTFLPTAAEGWTGVSTGGRHEVQIGQYKPGTDDPILATHYIYDAAGNLTDVWLPAVLDGDPSSPTHNTMVRPHWHYTYDASGNQLTQADPNGHTTSFAYDEQGRRISRTLPTGQTEYWTYDTFGRVLSHTDFDGQTSVEVYDDSAAAGGRLQAEYRFTQAENNSVFSGATLLTDNASEETTYGYNDLGRQNVVTERTNTPGSDAWSTARTTTTEYDPATGNVREIDSPEGTIRYDYDPATGNKVRMWTDHNDTAYEYDPQGRLTKVDVLELNDVRYATYTGIDPVTRNPTFTNIGTASAQTVAYTYDDDGNLATDMQPNDVLTTYRYDDLDRLVLETVTSGPTVIAQYDYDQVLVRDAGGTPNPALRLRSDGLRSGVVEYQEETDGTFSTVAITYSYDADGRLTGELRDVASGYDGNGEPIFSSTGAPDSPGDYADTFAFDLEGNRMTKAHTESDTAAAQTISYTYNAADQLTEETATGENPYDTTYTYDDNGSETSAARTGTNPEDHTYAWDLRNRMTASAETATASASGTTTATTATFTYDAAGVRVAETSTTITTPATGSPTTLTATTLYLNDPLNPTGYTKPVEEKPSATAAPRTSNILGLRVQGQYLTPTTGAPAVLYLLTDGHGSTRALVSADDRSVQERDDYDAFGTRLQTGSSMTNWLFAGDGAYDPATGWAYHLARWRIGFRFTSYDSFEADSATPQALHKYSYSDSDPVDGADFSGQYDEDFHYYVIYYLFMARGWDEFTAQSTAFWSQWVDEDAVTNPISLGTRAKIDPKVANLLRDYHFIGSSKTTTTKRNDLGAQLQLRSALIPFTLRLSPVVLRRCSQVAGCTRPGPTKDIAPTRVAMPQRTTHLMRCGTM